MGQLLSAVASHLSPPGDTATSQIISSHPSVICHNIPPHYWSLLSSLSSGEYRLQTTEYRALGLCEVWIWYLRLQIRRSELSHLTFLIKQGSPGGGDYRCWLVLVVLLTRPCENVPNISQSSRWRGDSECNALSCYNDHNTTTTTTTTTTSHL